MFLSKKYILRLILWWGIFGSASYALARGYIGGFATFLLLVAFASWTAFPILHFIFAAVYAQLRKHDPSIDTSLIFVSCILIFLVVVIASGLFNYV